MVGLINGGLKPVSRFSSTTPGGNFNNKRFSKLTHGDRVMLSGKPYDIIVLGGEETAFKPPKGLSEEDTGKFKEALEQLRRAAQVIARISDRLTDSEDGRTLEGVGKLAFNSDHLSPEFANRLRGYLVGIIKNGSNMHTSRGSILVPPCTQEEFEAELDRLPENVRKGFDWNSWLDHIYNPIPKVTEGFYLFSSNSWINFDALLASRDSKYTDLKVEARELFKKAIRDNLAPEELARYDAVSQQIMEMQKKVLESALEGDEYARGMSTRVRVVVDMSGEIDFITSHYTQEFKQELKVLRDQLLRARDSLPERASELRNVLTAQADWCIEKSTNPDWGQSLPVWIQASDASNLLDVNLTAEEKVSHLGAKGDFHITVTQHSEIPEGLEDLWATVRRSSDDNMLLLRTLLVGGHTTHLTVAGEKLPDPAGEPLYKVNIFTNTTALAIPAQVRAISAALGISEEEVLALGNVPLPKVIFHEFGHTLGDHAKWLGVHGGSTEETNAQASVVYLTAKLSPELLSGMLLYDSCWMPVRRTRQGPTEQHSRSDIVLFDEYLKVGALEIVERDGKHHVAVADTDALVATAFKTAIQMRLWEKGIPSEHHDQFQEQLDVTDADQDSRIIGKALGWVGAKPTEEQEALKVTTKTEVDAYFEDGRMREIAQKLDPVIANVPDEQPLSIIATDERLAALVA